MEGKNQVIGFVSLRTGVHLLRGKHFQRSPFRVLLFLAVADADALHTLGIPLGTGQIVHQFQHVAL